VRLVLRVGALLAAPRAALWDTDRDGGGVRLAVLLLFLGVLVFHLESALSVAAAVGALPGMVLVQSLIGLVLAEANVVAAVVLPASILVTLAAGAKRDPAGDFELGSAAYLPVFALRALEHAGEAWGLWPEERVGDVFLAASAGVALVFVVLAVRVARRRKVGPAPDLDTRRSWLAALALGLVIAAGMTGDAVAIARAPSRIAPVGSGTPAPAFTLPRIEADPAAPKQQIALSASAGRVVLLDFWATWCGPCLRMLPVVDGVARDWKDRGVDVLGVNSDGDGITDDELRSFLRAHPATYPMLRDDGRVGGLYKVNLLPQFVVVGRDGRIAQVLRGLATRADFDAALRAAGAGAGGT